MTGLPERTGRRPLVGFFALTFGFSWTLWAPLVVLRGAVPAALGFPLLLLGSLVPSTMAILLTGRAGGKAALRSLLGRLLPWRMPAAWYLLLLAPTGVTVLAVLFHAATNAPLTLILLPLGAGPLPVSSG
jgi:uncharacterized protein